MKKAMLLALALGVSTHAGANDAQQVLECMRGNVPSTLRVQDIELTSSDRTQATRSLRGKLFAQRKLHAGVSSVRVMLKVSAPENLAGSALLLREASQVSEQGMYLYLPSVRRVRRITGEFADGALLGSDFSYLEFRQLQNGFQDLDSTLEPSSVIEQRPVFVLSSTPAAGSPSSYGRIRSWVDQQTCVPLKVEFYRNQTVQKLLTIPVASLKQAKQRWYPAEANISDVKSGTSSQLRVLGVQSDSKIWKGTFEPGLFYRTGS